MSNLKNSGYRRLHEFFSQATARLMLTYIVIIMLMSLSFSIVIYITSARQLENQRPSDTILQTAEGIVVVPTHFQAFINERIDEAHKEIIIRLVFLNLATLALGSVASYYLARKNLEPIEASMRAQSQFVSDASHELRTPLTSLITTSEVALRRKKLTIDEAKEVITDAIDEAVKLQKLTDGLLRLVHDEDATEHFVPTDVSTLVSEAITQVAPKAMLKNISVHDKTNQHTIVAQPDAIERVLVVLLDNAIKYSDKGSVITIKSRQTTHSTFIKVIDTGEGIDPKDIDHIFTRFYRADKSRTGTNGYGLGLAIAKQIITNHGGTIKATSTPGAGSTFTIKLPTQTTG